MPLIIAPYLSVLPAQTPCTRGHYCPAKASAPLPCGPGTITSSTGQSVCQSCSAGYINNADSTGCIACAVGKFQGKLPPDVIATCCFRDPLAVTHSYYVLRFIAPHPASLADTSRPGQCTDCPSGQAQGTAGSISCANCIEGQYAASTGQSACDRCTVGKMSASGTTACTTCTAGTASSADNTRCDACAAGKYSTEGSGGCTSCPVGKYADKTGSSACTECAINTSTGSSSVGAQQCGVCPSGNVAPGGAAVCCSPLDLCETSGTGYRYNAAALTCDNYATNKVVGTKCRDANFNLCQQRVRTRAGCCRCP